MLQRGGAWPSLILFGASAKVSSMASEMNQETPQANGKATGGLKPTTAMLLADAIASPGEHPHFMRSLALRFAETTIFLVAVIGAIALGLGITAYFAEHHYVLAYLVAYAGFRFSDLIVREDAEDSPPREELSRRIAAQLPILVVFAAAPFERTYVYGGSAPALASALGLLRGDIPGDLRMDDHLRCAGHRSVDADHRSDSRAAADKVGRSDAACAIWRRVRSLHTRDGRADSRSLVVQRLRASSWQRA